MPTEAFVQNDLPSLNDDEGVLALTTLFGTTVYDQVHYFEDWHNTLLQDQNGVSLERVNPSKPTQDANNWQSGAQTFCFGTPGYRNSQFFEGTSGEDNIIIDPAILSPDGDGYQDALYIGYQFDQPGYILSSTIFDERGRKVKQLAQNQTAATEGSLTWDGSTDDGKKAPIGIYIIVIEMFNLNGDTETLKKTAVLAGRLN